jgi:hypothetical protein
MDREYLSKKKKDKNKLYFEKIFEKICIFGAKTDRQDHADVLRNMKCLEEYLKK